MAQLQKDAQATAVKTWRERHGLNAQAAGQVNTCVQITDIDIPFVLYVAFLVQQAIQHAGGPHSLPDWVNVTQTISPIFLCAQVSCLSCRSVSCPRLLFGRQICTVLCVSSSGYIQ